MLLPPLVLVFDQLFQSRSIYHENTRLHFITFVYVSKLLPSGSWLWLMTEREMMHPWSHLCLRGWGRGHTEGGSMGLAAGSSHLLIEQEKQGELCRAAHGSIGLWLRAMPWAKHSSFHSWCSNKLPRTNGMSLINPLALFHAIVNILIISLGIVFACLELKMQVQKTVLET